MKQRLSKQELVLVAGALALGCYLRFSALDQLAVEHFDEGVYSSPVWYGQVSEGVYPARHLYAPPALPAMIGAASSISHPQLAPFLPGLLAGSLTILVVWAFTRAAFGQVAGMVAVLLASLSDFHILYSRMALTDVPVLMWIALAVWYGVTGIERQCGKTMFFAGIACGCAWWTKYSGWLPLAIVSSGSAFWWILAGRKHYGLGRLIVLNGIMALTAAVVWSPWLWALQGAGGYEAVANNHRGYVMGWTNWQENLATQITWYSFTDSWLSALAITLGVTFSGAHRWFEARGSTWNAAATATTGVTPAVLGRFIGAAGILCIASLTIGSFAVLAAVGAGGILGMLLWPVITALRTESAEAVAGRRRKSAGPARYDQTDYHASPALDPQLSACVIAAWFCGLLVMTPTYTPYPRLFLPLVAALWIAAAAGIGWWMEACIGVARRSAASGTRPQLSQVQMLLTFLVLASVSLGVWTLRGTDVQRSTIHDSRLGLRDASTQVAEMCRDSAGIEKNAAATSDQPPQFIVYAFGEPAVLYHLNLDGVLAVPVQDVDFPAARLEGQRLPTFFVFGPNALRTPGFMYDWSSVEVERRFEHIGDVWYEASPIVLYNLFSPKWILQHPGEEQAQRLEVYRLK